MSGILYAVSGSGVAIFPIVSMSGHLSLIYKLGRQNLSQQALKVTSFVGVC